MKKFFCGPESFTPDLRRSSARRPSCKNYFVAPGSTRSASSPAAARPRAGALDRARPARRRRHRHEHRPPAPYQANPEYRARARSSRSAWSTRCHYPTRSMQTARGARRSPLHDRLAAQGAYFRDVSGWEGADWYAPPGVEPDPGPLTWGRPSWFDALGGRAPRRARGRDRHGHVVHGEVPGAGPRRRPRARTGSRRTTSTARRARSPTRSGSNEAAARGRPHRHEARRRALLGRRLRHRAPPRRDLDARAHPGRRARVRHRRDLGGYAQINVQGPRSRELLQSITSADLSNEAFPFRAAREIDIGFARVLCMRITYLGELGYELYVPTEQAVHVYDRLVAAGRAFGLRPRRPQGAREPAHGEGLPRLRPRHRQHRHPCSRPGSASRSTSTSRAASSARRGARAEGRRAAASAARAGAAEGSRAADVPRRDRAPRRQAARLRARGVVRPHARRRGRARDDRGEATKNGRNDQPLCGVPPSRNAGRCQRPHAAPTISAATNGT
jgi:hypothetical protein